MLNRKNSLLEYGLEKEYTLVNNKTKRVDNSNQIELSEHLSIDYDEYNNSLINLYKMNAFQFQKHHYFYTLLV